MYFHGIFMGCQIRLIIAFSDSRFQFLFFMFYEVEHLTLRFVFKSLRTHTYSFFIFNRMRHFCLILSFFILTSFFEQKPAESTVLLPPQYPQGYFASPVAGEMILSGSFGELRTNHFHAGIDIGPTRSGNEPIFASAEGYVARVRTQEAGYGQSVYIAHPNGYTTVYGHLNSFSKEILDIVRKKQYETETFEQDIILQPNELTVKQGQQIATMGNRGMSMGPHLHFEIRETATEKAVNPLLFGMNVSDNMPPRFEDMKVYFLDEKHEIISTKTYSLKKKSNSEYALPFDTIDVAAPYVAFAIQATDIHSGDSGQNGIFSLSLKSNDELLYRFKAEKCGFDESRYINAHIDYFEHQTNRYFFHRAFRLCGDNLSMYDSVRNDGIIALPFTTPNDSAACRKINLTAADIAGNTRSVSFVVRPKQQTTIPASKPYTYFFPYDKESVIKPDDAAIFYFPKGCFYDNVYAKFNMGSGQYGRSYQLHDPRTPIHYDMRIALKPLNLPDSLKTKAFIAYSTREDGQVFTCGGTWDSAGFLTTKSNKFGNYTIGVDRTPPTISVEDFGEKMAKTGRLAFKIKDNIEGRAVRYRTEMDGKWFLMEFDTKSDILFCRFEDLPSPFNTEGEHTLKITLTDDRDNVTLFQRRFELVDHIERAKPKPKPQASKGKGQKSKRH